MKHLLWGFILTSFAFQQAWGQNLYTPLNFQEAYQRQTRSLKGEPGPKYWQNRADYQIHLQIKPPSRLIKGRESIVYYNNSPDTLKELNFKLIQNTRIPSTSRANNVANNWLTKGLTIQSIQIAGKPMPWDNMEVNSSENPTNHFLPLAQPLLPGQQLKLELNWTFELGNSSDGDREGVVDKTTFFLAYFFPRIAVYDDLDGWDDVQLNEQTEYYNDFGNFELSVELPQNYLVWATGVLQNPEQVLQAPFVQKFKSAAQSNQVQRIVDHSALKRKKVTLQSPNLVWKFKAENVTDVALGLSDHYCWDAVSAKGNEGGSKQVFVQTAYHPESEDYPEMADICRKTVEYYSTQMPGFPFPYPVLTAFNGLGQMEYPMMINDITLSNPDDVITLATHEIAHQYLPFMMGTNESRWAWMDEGWASFFEYHASLNAFEIKDPGATFPDYYQYMVSRSRNAEMDVPLYTPSNQQFSESYGFNAYGKAAAAYTALKLHLGEGTFKKCLHEYFHRWAGKHPAPHDFFNTISDACGENLNWFWQTWFFDFNTVNLRIAEVNSNSIRIENPGGKPIPIQLKLNYSDGSSAELKEPLGIWKGRNSVVLPLPVGKSLVKAELLQSWFHEKSLRDNVWNK
jgi:hypothetical protein